MSSSRQTTTYSQQAHCYDLCLEEERQTPLVKRHADELRPEEKRQPPLVKRHADELCSEEERSQALVNSGMLVSYVQKKRDNNL